MAMKAFGIVLFVCFLGSASACTDDNDCDGDLQTCCSDFVCREACKSCFSDSQCTTGECCDKYGVCTKSCSDGVCLQACSCSSDSQCGTGECCKNGKCTKTCSDGVCREACNACYLDSQCGTGECCDTNNDSKCKTSCSHHKKVNIGAIIASLAVFTIIVAWIAGRYYWHRHTVLVRSPGYRRLVNTTCIAIQQTIRYPPPAGSNPPPTGSCNQPPPYSAFPREQASPHELAPYPPFQDAGPVTVPPLQVRGPTPPPQGQAPYPQSLESTGQPDKR